jgi:hypothetical protein
MPGPTTTWIVALLFGAIIVGFKFWFWFDEPSFDTETEYFSRYKPRFSTYYPRYTRARYGYVLTFIIIFVVFSAVPEIFLAVMKAIALDTGAAQTGVLPIVVALALINFQRTATTKNVEREIRAFFHAFAKIPEGVRRIVAAMRNCEVVLPLADVSRETNRLGLAAEHENPELISSFVRHDEMIGLWYRTGVLLDALSAEKRSDHGIVPLFFDEYDAEINSIQTEHARLADAVRTHLVELIGKPGTMKPGVVSDCDMTLVKEVKELKNLAQRLYTFVACGVQSSVNTELEAATILKDFGCSNQLPVRIRADVLAIVLPIAGLAFVAVMIISVFTAFLTGLFRREMLTPLVSLAWDEAFKLPKDVFGMYVWSWTTAFYYGAALIGALAVRELRIATRHWSDLNKASRERPLLRYVAPTLGGAALGSVLLIFIALANGPGLSLAVAGMSEIEEAAILALPWFPLAMAMALTAIWLVDFGLFEDRYLEVSYRSILGGLFMGAIGLLTAEISTDQTVALFAEQRGLEFTGNVFRAIIYVSLFIALLITIFSSVLCFIIQVAEIQIGKGRRLSGGIFRVVSLQGGPFILKLNGDATATISIYSDSASRPDQRRVIRGKWLQFPEGTVVRWSSTSDELAKLGDIGIISLSDQILVYEGYEGAIQGEPCVVAHLERLNSPEIEQESLLGSAVSQHG